MGLALRTIYTESPNDSSDRPAGVSQSRTAPPVEAVTRSKHGPVIASACLDEAGGFVFRWICRDWRDSDSFPEASRNQVLRHARRAMLAGGRWRARATRGQ